MKVRYEVVNTFRWILDEKLGIGVEVKYRERGFFHYIEISTYNENGSLNRIESFYLPKWPRSSRLFRWMINRKFNKLAHRFEEWGLPKESIKFPWK